MQIGVFGDKSLHEMSIGLRKRYKKGQAGKNTSWEIILLSHVLKGTFLCRESHKCASIKVIITLKRVLAYFLRRKRRLNFDYLQDNGCTFCREVECMNNVLSLLSFINQIAPSV